VNVTTEEQSLLFDAVLYPHRSLGPAGFWLLMGFVSAVSFAAGTAFYLAGAWPVVGFLGLDIVLIYLAFRANYRAARVRETLELRSSELRVRRLGGRGEVLREWTFQPYWLRVEIDEPPQHHSQLALCSHGRRLVVGAFLTPGERLEVAQALRRALGRCAPAPGSA